MKVKNRMVYLSFFFGTMLGAQVGINTSNPHPSSALDINADNKGLLIPRMDLSEINSQSPVLASQPAKDGLLVYGKSVANIPSDHLFCWDGSSFSWNRQLYMKETPITALIGLKNDVQKLNDADGGGREALVVSGSNNYTVLISGNMPILQFVDDSRAARNSSDILLSPGSYELELSLALSAPVPDAGHGATITGGYYNMGYFNDIRLFTYSSATWPTGNSFYNNRSETAVLSKANEIHFISFFHSFTITEPTAVELYIGRMSGSSHRDTVSILAKGSFIKIVKIN